MVFLPSAGHDMRIWSVDSREEVQPGSKAAAAEDGLFGEAGLSACSVSEEAGVLCEVPSVYDVLRNQFADINRENQRPLRGRVPNDSDSMLTF